MRSGDKKKTRSQAAAAPDHEGKGEGEHHSGRGPADLHNSGLALQMKEQWERGE